MLQHTKYPFFTRHCLKINIIVALTYILVGYINSKLIFPLSSTALIFPAGGIVLGIILVYGMNVIPGMFVGVFTINYAMLALQKNMFFSPNAFVFIVIIFAIGITLQVISGKILIETIVGVNNLLYAPKDIIIFILLAGPVVGCVNALFSTSLIYLFHLISPRILLIGMGNWWVRDCLTRVVFTPLILILFQKPQQVWRERFFPVAIPLFISFIATNIVYGIISKIQPFDLVVWFFLIGGFVFCTLMAILLFIFYGQKKMIQITVEERTKELAEEHARSTLLLESAGDGIFQVNTEFKTTYINTAAANMLGYTVKELLGKNIHEIIHHSHPDGTPYALTDCSTYQSLMDGKTHKLHNEMFWRKDGSSFWINHNNSPLFSNGKVIGAMVIFSDISKQHLNEVKLAHLAMYDTLTGIANRLSFFQELPKAMARAKRNNTLLAVCFMDLDNFKTINDTLGHDVGDKLLQSIVGIMQAIIRETDFIGRLGGDEFGLILENVTSKDEVKHILARYINEICNPIALNDIPIKITVSIGVSIYPDHGGNSSEELVKNADIAMYTAKKNGRNQYVLF